MPDFCFSRLWGDRGWLGCNELSKWGIVPLRGRLALLTCLALGTWRQLEHLCLIIEHEREKWKPIYKRALKRRCGHTWPYNGYHGCWNLTVTLVRITRSKQQRGTCVNGGKINTARYEGGPFLSCFVSIWALPERGGDVKACQDGLGTFFTLACLTEGGSKAIWALPI